MGVVHDGLMIPKEGIAPTRHHQYHQRMSGSIDGNKDPENALGEWKDDSMRRVHPDSKTTFERNQCIDRLMASFVIRQDRYNGMGC